jgi:hypothetical protein
MRAGKYLAVTCLLFGAALAAFVSGSLEPRLGHLFFLGVMPAVGFYAGGYVLGLGRVKTFSCKRSELEEVATRAVFPDF